MGVMQKDMAMKTIKKHIKAIIQLRRATEQEWIDYNPILCVGEPALSTDKNSLKVGNGKDRWLDIPYLFQDDIDKLVILLDEKVDKEDGKSLSSNDYTDEERNKLAGIEDGSQENVIEEVLVNGSSVEISDKSVDIHIPTDVSELNNDAGYLTEHQSLDDYATKEYVDEATEGITSNLVDLTDTEIINPTNGQVLTYDNESGKWVNDDTKAIHEDADDIEILNMLTELGYTSPLCDSSGSVIVDSTGSIITV